MRFSRQELVDLVVAWVVLSLAFSILLAGGPSRLLRGFAPVLVVLSMLTVGVAFLLHELAHKVVAVRFGQDAEFRADYGMLFLAVMSALVGFLFAAPGAVHHRGRITRREGGLIALAGPVTNLALAVPFAVVFVVGGETLVGLVGRLGLQINLILAAFNMAPYGPLDGRTVVSWSKPVFGVVFVPAVALALWALTGFPGL